MSYDTTPAGRGALAGPALSVEDWREATRSPAAAALLLRRHLDAATGVPAAEAAGHVRAAAALVNYLLPEGHPEKVTRPGVEALRAAAGVYRDALSATFGPLGARRQPWGEMAAGADALGALLPPEAPER
jgi:hypothetical protein